MYADKTLYSVNIDSLTLTAHSFSSLINDHCPRALDERGRRVLPIFVRELAGGGAEIVKRLANGKTKARPASNIEIARIEVEAKLAFDAALFHPDTPRALVNSLQILRLAICEASPDEVTLARALLSVPADDRADFLSSLKEEGIDYEPCEEDYEEAAQELAELRAVESASRFCRDVQKIGTARAA